jgi:ATP-binding cassette subfamily B protein
MVLSNQKYTLFSTVKISFAVSPVISGLMVAHTVIAALIPTLQVILVANFIDAVLKTLRRGADISVAYSYLMPVILMLAYQWIMGSLVELGKKRLECGLREKFRTAMTEKRARLEYGYIENPAALDLVNRVSDKPEEKISAGLTHLLTGLSLLLRIGGLLLLLIVQVWWTAVAIIALSIPLFYAALKSGHATYQANQEVTRYKRRYQYLSDVMIHRDGIEERTVFGYNRALNEIWSDQYEAARQIELKAQVKWFIKLKSGSVLTALISMIITAVLLNPVLAGVISLGMYISVVSATFGLVHSMSWEMVRCVDALAQHREYLNDLSEFAKMKDEAEATCRPAAPPVFESLVFSGVRFKYPNTENYILDGLSLELHAGRHYAFVGLNGAGKSTLIKLLTGLYHDYEGRIMVNAKDIMSYSPGELKAFFAVVYQDFAKYGVTLKENIALGNMRGCDDEQIQAAVDCMALGDLAEKLPQGMDTSLGKIQPTGQDISGGEWQRVALARAIVSQAPVCILDEPTAALDPMSECRLYEEFGRISQAKTTFFLSHRLGSTKLADEIFVIGAGRVLEHGTHTELMLLDGAYRNMYESQRSWYQ